MHFLDPDPYYAEDLARSLHPFFPDELFYYHPTLPALEGFFFSPQGNSSSAKQEDLLLYCPEFYPELPPGLPLKSVELHLCHLLSPGERLRVREEDQSLLRRPKRRNELRRFSAPSELAEALRRERTCFPEKMSSPKREEGSFCLAAQGIFLLWQYSSRFRGEQELVPRCLDAMRSRGQKALYLPLRSVFDIDPRLLPHLPASQSPEILFSSPLSGKTLENLLSDAAARRLFWKQMLAGNDLGCLSFAPFLRFDLLKDISAKEWRLFAECLKTFVKEEKLTLLIDMGYELAEQASPLIDVADRIYFPPLRDPRLRAAWELELNRVTRLVPPDKLSMRADFLLSAPHECRPRRLRDIA